MKIVEHCTLNIVLYYVFTPTRNAVDENRMSLCDIAPCPQTQTLDTPVPEVDAPLTEVVIDSPALSNEHHEDSGPTASSPLGKNDVNYGCSNLAMSQIRSCVIPRKVLVVCPGQIWSTGSFMEGWMLWNVRVVNYHSVSCGNVSVDVQGPEQTNGSKFFCTISNERAVWKAASIVSLLSFIKRPWRMGWDNIPLMNTSRMKSSRCSVFQKARKLQSLLIRLEFLQIFVHGLA